MRPGPLHVAEIGCGCGSSLFPVLNANSGAVVTATDVSPTCIDQFKQAATTYGIQPQRIKSTFVVDASDPCAAPLFGPVAADLVLVMFTLSALAPPQQAVLLRHAYLALKPGGRLLVRDHGLYDMVRECGTQYIEDTPSLPWELADTARAVPSFILSFDCF